MTGSSRKCLKGAGALSLESNLEANLYGHILCMLILIIALCQKSLIANIGAFKGTMFRI